MKKISKIFVGAISMLYLCAGYSGQVTPTATATITKMCALGTPSIGALALNNGFSSISTDQPGGSRSSFTVTITGTGTTGTLAVSTVALSKDQVTQTAGTSPYYANIYASSSSSDTTVLASSSSTYGGTSYTANTATTYYLGMFFPVATGTWGTGAYSGSALVTCS